MFKDGLEELYAIMQQAREQYYKRSDKDQIIDICLFFRLYKLVCDMRTIQRIVENE